MWRYAHIFYILVSEKKNLVNESEKKSELLKKSELASTKKNIYILNQLSTKMISSTKTHIYSTIVNLFTFVALLTFLRSCFAALETI